VFAAEAQAIDPGNQGAVRLLAAVAPAV
jgi:hypothetical protein